MLYLFPAYMALLYKAKSKFPMSLEMKHHKQLTIVTAWAKLRNGCLEAQNSQHMYKI